MVYCQSAYPFHTRRLKASLLKSFEWEFSKDMERTQNWTTYLQIRPWQRRKLGHKLIVQIWAPYNNLLEKKKKGKTVLLPIHWPQILNITCTNLSWPWYDFTQHTPKPKFEKFRLRFELKFSRRVIKPCKYEEQSQSELLALSPSYGHYILDGEAGGLIHGPQAHTNL